MIKVQKNNINPVIWTPRALSREWNRKDRNALSLEIATLIGKDDIILDVASGGAIEIKRLRENGVKNKIDACDFWEELGDYYKTKTKPELDISNYFACDVTKDIPVPNNSYDIVLACEIVEHLDDPYSFLSKLIKIARKRVIVTCPYKTAFACDEHVWQFDLGDFGFLEYGKFLSKSPKCKEKTVHDYKDYILAVYEL